MINECYIGNCMDGLTKFRDASVTVQTCVTSPPYFGLRDYGVADQFGLEDTPADYVANMVKMFDMVREVLADDGTVWLNIGDSYAGSWGAEGRQGEGGEMAGRSVVSARQIENHPKRSRRIAHLEGIKPKDLFGIPWLLAFALRDAGWYLRQDIIWHKPNPMPESVRDRCTKSHEYIFLLSKSKRYYFDHEAIREPASYPDGPRNMKPYDVPNQRPGVNANVGGSIHKIGARETRNKRSVWTVNTRPFKGAHFAVFPPDLIEPCILAGSRPGDVVLDPFMGSGTTAQVAEHLGRQWIGCELNEEYVPLQAERLKQSALPLGV